MSRYEEGEQWDLNDDQCMPPINVRLQSAVPNFIVDTGAIHRWHARPSNSVRGIL